MIRGLLLCGGKASRFGADKLCVPIDGVPLAAHSARNLMQGAGNVLAVIPRGKARLRDILAASGCEILESPDTTRGLGASLAAGVAASAGEQGWIVALGDMPFIQASTIAAVKDRIAKGALIAAPVLRAGQRGHPVGFARALRDDLLSIDGDEGARSILAVHGASIALVEVDDPGILKDIDTPGDLDRG